jgi:hypothetical protein
MGQCVLIFAGEGQIQAYFLSWATVVPFYNQQNREREPGRKKEATTEEYNNGSAIISFVPLTVKLLLLSMVAGDDSQNCPNDPLIIHLLRNNYAQD